MHHDPCNVSCRFASLALIFVLGCGGGVQSTPAPTTAAPDTHALRLANTSWPPFTGGADQRGVAQELVRVALERAGYASTTEIVPDGTLTDALREGRYDGSGALWLSEDRKAFLLFSEPYLENRLVLIGPPGSAVDVASLAELAGKRIGAVKGYAYGPDVEDVSGPVLVRGDSTEQNLRDLLAGKLDFVLTDELVGHHLLQHYPEQTAQHLAIGSRALSTRTLHLALRKDVPNAREILDRFNLELLEMRAEGAYNRVLELRWIRADVDGDGDTELVAGGERVGSAPPVDGYTLVSAPAGSGEAPHAPRTAQFVVRGVPYDTWEAIPQNYRQDPEPDTLSSKPRTLRVSIFEF